MKKILSKLQKIENIIIVLAFAIMTFCSFAQVVNRNLFQLPIPWFDEASGFCMIYMALLGTEMGLRDGSQIAVTAVVDRLGTFGKSVIKIIAKLIVVIFSGTALYYSILMVEKQAVSGQTTAALHVSMAIPYMALVISFGIITVIQSVIVIRMCISLANGRNNLPREV